MVLSAYEQDIAWDGCDWPRQLGPLLVVSPHLDDAVFGCGDLIAAHPGSTVVTVFAGVPEGFRSLTEWDAVCGFLSAREAVLARRREDRTALGALAAQPVWLPFADAQYGDTPRSVDITRALRRVMKNASCDTVVFPLGLFHSDHALAHAAALILVHRYPDLRWVAYEEPMYRRVPGALADRIDELRRAGLHPTPLAGLAAPPSKQRAVACYRSQLRALATPGRAGHADTLAPERYWRLRA